MKKAIIIGATSGIGKGLARLLAKNNYRVGITGRRNELLQELKEETPGSYLVSSFDVTEPPGAIEHLEKLATELGGIDLLIICSGTGDNNETPDF